MAAKLTISSSSSFLTNTTTSKLLLSPPGSSHTILCSPWSKSNHFKISAKLGGGGGQEELKPGDKKKFITKEQEPEQYWQSAGEREGENPMKTPLPYIIIFGMSTPFIILAIAFANGWIKMPIR